jgi:ribonuclease HI
VGWRKANFKGKEVWVEVDAEGIPVAEGGRVPIRYSASGGAKIYRAGAAGVELAAGKTEDLPAGTSADDAAAATSPRPAAPGRPAGRGSGFGSAGSRTATQAAAAKVDAHSRIAALPPETILAFTDGACNGNPGPAGAGLVLKVPGQPVIEKFRSLGHGTNNVGELTGILMALESLDELATPTDAKVVVFTDSDYARGVLTLNWKPKANQELISKIKLLMRRRPSLQVQWLAGHTGIAENERADALARKGANGSSR